MAQSSGARSPFGMDERPNILFLFNDHQIHYRHGWDVGPRPLRPRFEAFAAQGIRFRRAYTACALCGPARRTVLTGLYPHTHGEIQNDVDASYAHEVYLDALAACGYHNYIYGKWHAGPGTALNHHCRGLSLPGYGNPYIQPAYRAYLRERDLAPAKHLIERGFLPQYARREGRLYRCEGRHCQAVGERHGGRAGEHALERLSPADLPRSGFAFHRSVISSSQASATEHRTDNRAPVSADTGIPSC